MNAPESPKPVPPGVTSVLYVLGVIVGVVGAVAWGLSFSKDHPPAGEWFWMMVAGVVLYGFGKLIALVWEIRTKK